MTLPARSAATAFWPQPPAGYALGTRHLHHGDQVVVIGYDPTTGNLTVAYTATGQRWDLSTNKALRVLVPC